MIQPIQPLACMDEKTWDYVCTDERPVPRKTYPPSVTVRVSRLGSKGTAEGLGEVMLNYRSKRVLKDLLALAPRLSMILPTGSNREGSEVDTIGFQSNLPLSAGIGDSRVGRWNLGMTHVPDARGPNGLRKDPTGVNYGASVTDLASAHGNLMLELAGVSDEFIQGDRSLTRKEPLAINPGVRCPTKHRSRLQIVPGIGVPIGVGPGRVNTAPSRISLSSSRVLRAVTRVCRW